MRTFLLVFVGILLIGCESSKNIAKKTSDGRNLEQLINDKSFEVVLRWAQPNGFTRIASLGLLPPGDSANSINLSNNSSSFVKKGDDLDILLPYYGEQLAGRAYKDNGSIQFEGVPDSYSIDYNEKKKNYQIKFKIKDGTELYNISVQLYENLYAKVYVNSSHRTSINYTGVVREIKE